MENNFSVWQDEEIKTLFKFVEVKRSEGMALINIFKEFGKSVGRCQNSVRNYYYREVKELANNEKRCNSLKINIKNHIAKTPIPFTEKETENIVDRINKYVMNGYSVRRACLELAGGDATKMIRYQNKYRSKLKQKGKENDMGNIIKMPEKRNIMSDEDIKALFMGLLNLVKKQESLKIKDIFESEMESANNKLRNAMNEIILKSEKIAKLQAQITLLKKEIEDSKQKEITKRVKLANSTAKQLIAEFVQKNSKDENISNKLICD